ncbi:MAG: hypothetical protein GWP09_02005 [Nitrospiraceae bacterium]|nr:hypothetical protein [Nitrospiraceae bacterium]
MVIEEKHKRELIDILKENKRAYTYISELLSKNLQSNKLSLEKIYEITKNLFYKTLSSQFKEPNLTKIIKTITKFLYCEQKFYYKISPLRKNGDPQLSHFMSVLYNFLKYYNDFDVVQIITAIGHDFGEDHGAKHFELYKNELKKSKDVILLDNSDFNQVISWQNIINKVTLDSELVTKLKFLGINNQDIEQIKMNIKYLTRYPGEHYLDYIMKLIYYSNGYKIDDYSYFNDSKRLLEKNISKTISHKSNLSSLFVKLSDKLHNTLTLRDNNGILFSLGHAIRDITKNLYIFHVYKLVAQQYAINFILRIPKEKRKEITGTNKIINTSEDLERIYPFYRFFNNYYNYIKNNYHDNREKLYKIKISERINTLWLIMEALSIQSQIELKKIVEDIKKNLNSEELSEIKRIDKSFEDYTKTPLYHEITPVKSKNEFDGIINSILILTRERRLRTQGIKLNKESKIKIYKTTLVLSKIFDDYLSNNSFYIKGFENIDGRLTLFEKKLKTIISVVNEEEKKYYEEYKNL